MNALANVDPFEAPDVPVPDANGCFKTPAEGAKFMASMGVLQTILNGKIPLKKNWQNEATTDFTQIDRWAAEYPGCNFGSVMKAEVGGYYAIETDSPAPRAAFKNETQKDFSARLVIKSGPGRAHWYYKHDAESLAALANIGQTSADGFSLRLHNEQCVSPGSYHPERKTQYAIVSQGSPTTATAQEINWLKTKKNDKTKKLTIASPNDPIPEHRRNVTLTSIGGALREKSLVYEEILAVLTRKNEECCTPPLDQSEIETISRSVSRYEVGKPNVVLHGGIPAGTTPDVLSTTTPSISTNPEVVSVIDDQFQIAIEKMRDRTSIIEKPEFPEWTIRGTSIYRNVCEPAAKLSSKIPFLIFMPLMVTYLNYLSTKVSIKGLNATPFTIFLGSIACQGSYKSSSAELGFKFFKMIGLLDHYSPAIGNANSKQLVFTAGSTEGLGLGMSNTRCHNAIIYNDELRKAAQKMGIEGSSFSSDLLTVYESGKFSNAISNPKKFFSHEPGAYCVSWVFCTTIKSFMETWPRIAGKNTDLMDRMFLILGPEKVVETEKSILFHDPDLTLGADETCQLIMKAVNQGVYDYEDFETANEMIREGLKGLCSSDVDEGDSVDLSMPRMVGLVQKLALFFAVDLGEDYITNGCLERAIALVQYRASVIRYLRPIEADSNLGILQQTMIHVLKSHGGQMPSRDWKKYCNYHRHDTDMWGRAQGGLERIRRIRVGLIKTMSGQKRNLVTLLKDSDED